MKASLQKLRNIINIEVEKGYGNYAVVGGLDRLLDFWVDEARAEGVPEDFIQAVISRLHNYPRLTPNSRAEALQGLLKRLQRLQPDHAAPFRQPEHTPGEAKSQPSQPAAARRPPEKSIEKKSKDQGTDFSPASLEKTHPHLRGEATKVTPVEPGALDASITVIQGIGPRHAQTLARLELLTLRDLLYNFPRRYIDYSLLKPINRLVFSELVTVIGAVQNVNIRKTNEGRRVIVEAILVDGSGSLRLIWFNQEWIARRLQRGEYISVSGKTDQYLGRMVMSNPEWEPLDQQQLNTNRIVPVYSLTTQITQRWLRRLMAQVVEYWAPRVPDPLPESIRNGAGVLDLPTALAQIHFPESWDILHEAQQRLAFDEVFLLQLGAFSQKRLWQERTGRIFSTEPEWLSAQLAALPYTLTGAQQKALADVQSDLASGRSMNRLLQGDVGSGKTVIAALTAAMVINHGAQAAVMAPTSILAEQHLRNFYQLLVENHSPDLDQGISGNPQTARFRLEPGEIRLLLGGTPESEKRQIRQGLGDGSIRLVIGTHALIEDPISFNNLQLVVIDEQHRFGVDQRSALRLKGENTHLLVMTATPIPRSLALTIYGDLDLTVMDEMPPGRQPVGTFVLQPRERERAYNLIRRQVELGYQAYMIFPLVEESEKSEAMAAVEEHARLQSDVFPHLRLGLLHGRMSADEKDEVMHRFKNGEYPVLVATSVVEVGMDVPKATVMVIEGANRFGLAQLHQFRGRVGRGAGQSFCILIPDSPDAAENERLQVMVETNDGFVLAERDLQQRGPGQFLGTRQSGFGELRMASLSDIRLIEKARRLAQTLIEQDPELNQAGHALLRTAFQKFWTSSKASIS